MNKKRNIQIATVIIGLILTIFAGITYAFFTANIGGSETSTTITVEGGKLVINYSGGADISLNGIYPKDEAWVVKNFTLSGTNTTDLNMYYKISLVVDENTFSTNLITFDLTSTNTSNNGSVAPNLASTNIATGSNVYALGNGTFTNGNNLTHSYILKIYFKNSELNQNMEQGKTFKAHVLTESTGKIICDANNVGVILNGQICSAPSENCFTCQENKSKVQLANGMWTCK